MHPLIQAAELIEQHIAPLDTSQSVCECCGLTKYVDFYQTQQHRELSAMARKLRERYYRPPLSSKSNSN